MTSGGRLAALLAGAATVALVCARPVRGDTGRGARSQIPAAAPSRPGRRMARRSPSRSSAGSPARILASRRRGRNGSGRRQLPDLGRDAPQSISWSLDGSRLATTPSRRADRVYTRRLAQPRQGAEGMAPLGARPRSSFCRTLRQRRRPPGLWSSTPTEAAGRSCRPVRKPRSAAASTVTRIGLPTAARSPSTRSAVGSPPSGR